MWHGGGRFFFERKMERGGTLQSGSHGTPNMVTHPVSFPRKRASVSFPRKRESRGGQKMTN